MVSSALYTSKTVEWETPQKLFDELNQEFHFNLVQKKNAKCEKYFTKLENGLNQDWQGYRVFL